MAYLSPADFDKVRAALALSAERLEINDCEGEEREHLAAVEAAGAIMAKAASFEAGPAEIEAARAEWQTDDLELDDERVATSPGDGGTWFNAWVWMPEAD
jgi:hypothetical protein